ncbi:c-type cytochrome [Pontibacter flavimaris]|uniref:Cytochrome C n=1 Tax=Pontibacter flavimaris TaxID=1797110 RepID=A0A1Q5PC64_9BACT|nr:c-type cytochrome [Pontibacter flavimaris]OKL39839.1 cytochrome C [Pontibacter flavimaris]
MKKALKVVGYLVVVALVAIAAGAIYLQYAFPNVDAAPTITVRHTAEQVERGRYLANHVTVCIDCHSTRDFSQLSAPPVPGTFGKGGDKFDHNMGFPGTFYAKNITPDKETGIGTWTDGEVYRAMTQGVSKDGEPLFPLMPYGAYKQLTTQDAYAIIAYIRTLEPIRNEVPESDADFPFNLILRTMPSSQMPKATNPASLNDELLRGEYLVAVASCGDCHSPKDADLGAFAGGMDFKFPDGSVLRSANITPDRETGIGSWSEENFLQRFKAFQDTTQQLKPGQMQTLMPWKMYAGMKEEDLRAIYKYLRAQAPAKNQVVRFTPPAKP